MPARALALATTLALAAAAYVPEEALVATANYYVGVGDSETVQCNVYGAGGWAAVSHTFGAGGSGGGWAYGVLYLLLDPADDGDLDLTRAASLSLNVSSVAGAVLHVDGTTLAPPDTLAYSATGTMHRAPGQLACPAAYCVPPPPSDGAGSDGVSTPWCGWAPTEGAAGAAAAVPLEDGVDARVRVDVSPLLRANYTMLKVWVAPVCGDDAAASEASEDGRHNATAPCYMWNARAVLSDFSLKNDGDDSN